MVSSDGVNECKSNTNSLDVFSTKFTGCRSIYPVQILRPIGRYRLNQQKYLDNFLADICSNRLCIRCFIGDNPKRAIARASKAHSAYYPCEYCEAKGALLQNEDAALIFRKNQLQKQKDNLLNRLNKARENSNEEDIECLTVLINNVHESIKTLNRKNNNIVWPASSQNGDLRTIDKVLHIVERLDNGDILSLDEAKGIMGRSLFLDIPYFNYVQDITVEYLHLVCLGVVKRMLECTFNVGENRQRNTTRKLSEVSLYNSLIAKVLFVREFSRRARNLDFAVMKGQEYRNIIILFFPLIVNCIPKKAKERRLWLLLAYMIRMCIIPDNEYEILDSSVLQYCQNHFYTLYEKLFHARNCSYNTHIVGSHLLSIRVHGPFTATSAFAFESFYGEMRNSFTPGTRSPLKQILENVLMKRVISPHCCKPSIYYSPKETPLESNSLIYTFVDEEYHLFKIISMDKDSNTMECLKVGKYEATFEETPTLNWGKIGVFKCGGISDEIVSLHVNTIAGKVLRVDNLFLTCPINVLEEK